MIYKNGEVFLEGFFKKADIYVEDGVIKNIVEISSDGTTLRIEDSLEIFRDSEIVDCTDKYIIPGLVDVHTHACVGEDFTFPDEKALDKMTEYYYNAGVSTVLATTMTYDKEELLKAAERIASYRQKPEHAVIAGIHMEGPFFGPAKKGAQNEKYLSTVDEEFLEAFDSKSNHLLKIVSFDPLVEGAYNLLRKYKDRYVLSIGHTACDYEVAMDYMALGALHVTHTFNGMNAYDKREPGVEGAVLDTADCYAELICDGIHIHPSVIRMMFKCHGDHIVLISDSMSATGLEDGEYSLGGQEVSVRGRKATLKDGTIAGSATNLCEMMQNAISFGVPKEQAVAAATVNAAESAGIAHIAGVIEIGRKADLLVADKDFKRVDRLGKY